MCEECNSKNTTTVEETAGFNPDGTLCVMDSWLLCKDCGWSE